MNGKNSPETRFFKEKGIQPAKAPQGFFVYNYGAAGIHRRANWMVTLKGFNTNVWGSEIYTKDNRYGRYQSYGSIQIMGYPSRKASGYVEEGWDWNRLPGTTTIHLPLVLLDNPRSGTLMARSTENFAGTSSLEGRNGMFAMKLKEAIIRISLLTLWHASPLSVSIIVWSVWVRASVIVMRSILRRQPFFRVNIVRVKRSSP